MNAVGCTLTLLFALAVVLLPRRFAVLGVIAAVCYITQAQQYIVGGFHFTAIRIVLLSGLIRLVMRGELNLRLNKIDWAFIWYVSTASFIPIIRNNNGDELVYRLGCAYDILLSYWVLRGLLRNWSDLEMFAGDVAFLIIPMALEMIQETLTHKSLFESFGGIGELTIREGRPRCQGAFRIGITAGIFGATLLPLFIGLFRMNVRRGAAVVGIVTALIITYTSNSSGSLMAAVSSIVAWLFWPLRTNMQKVRRGIVATLVGLHLSMKVPIWFIFSKLGALTGGDGWHRSYLIDQFIHFFPNWWLMGTSYTGDWMPTVLKDGSADLTDMYVAAGVTGGLACLICLILLFVRSFRYLGFSRRELNLRTSDSEALCWGLGAALFSHLVTLFSITYWDQLHVILWGSFGIFSSMTSHVLEDQAEQVATENTFDPSQDTTISEQEYGLGGGVAQGSKPNA